MRSYKRKKEIERKNKTRKLGKLIILIIVLTFVLSVLFNFFKTPHFWNGRDKISLVVQKTTGDVSVIVFDPRLGEEIILNIPSNTEVDVAENLGRLTIKNVWKLGQVQKIGGRILSETVTKNFLFPCYLWSDAKAESLIKPSLFGILDFVFRKGSSNLSFSDRVSLAFFSLKTKDINKSEVDLGKSQFLKKGKISDGSLGFFLSGEVLQRLTANFSDYGFSDRTVRIFVKDYTGSPGVSDRVGQILEVMGGKVVSIEKLSLADEDCAVSGGDLDLITKVSRLFSCKTSISGGKDEIELILGSKFAKRF